MMRINLYSQSRHIVIIDGVPLSGFGDGDFMQVKLDGNVAARTAGADGPAISLSTDQGGAVTLSLLPTSPVLGILYALRDAQKSNPRLFSIVLMSGVEEVITCSGCAIGELPQFATGGPQMSARQFTFECSKISLDVSAVEAIGGGLIGGVIGG
jgi:hypothetical protein